MYKILVLSVATVLSSAASAQQPMPHSGSMPMAMPMMDSMMPRENDSAATKGYKISMMTMMHGMPKDYSGNADIDFMRQMRAHHQGAIDMAEVVVKHGRDESVKKLARTIIQDQRKEIGEIDEWLKKNPR